MPDFRKLIVVLAIMAVATVAAFGQTTVLTCTATVAGNPTLRGGGITELTGEIVLNCTGGTAGVTGDQNVAVSVQMQNTTAITNRTVGGTTAVGTPTNAALQVVDFNGNISQLVRGNISPASQNVMVFQDVILPRSTTQQLRLRIGNIRVAVPVMANTETARPIYGYVTTSVNTADPLNGIVIQQPLQQVGQVLPPFTFDVTSCTGGAGGTTSFRQCISSPSVDTDVTFGVRFTELNNAGAFRQLSEEHGQTFTGPAVGPINPVTTLPAPSNLLINDIASNGTRLMVQFTNVPAGVNLFVTVREIGGASATTGLARAALVSGAGVDGSGGTVGTAATKGATCGTGHTTVVVNEPASGDPLTVPPNGLAAASTSGSTIYAVWEVTSDSVSATDSFVFGVQVQYTADPGNGLPALTLDNPGAVIGTMAPWVPTTYVPAADSTSPIPRFVVSNPSASVFAIVPCVTNLLFPYVTNAGGFNSGLALSNTSKDTGIFDTSSQTGTCTLYFYGDNAIDPLVTAQDNTPAANADGEIEPGTVGTIVVGDVAPGFTGYVIARCNFQYAHGLAFVTNGGSFSTYLALVIPDTASVTRFPDPFSASGSGTGEQLGY